MLAVQRDDRALVFHQLSEMGSLPAGSCTGIENTFSRLRVKQRGNELSRFIFNITPPVLYHGKSAGIAAFFKNDSNRAHGSFSPGNFFHLQTIQ